MTADELLALSDEREQWMRRVLAAERAAYEAQSALLEAQRAADRTWAAQPPAKVPGGPALAELEARRWELHGEARTRETFADPHPADYPGILATDERRAA